jgi:Xaa-Pro aminopeptidase
MSIDTARDNRNREMMEAHGLDAVVCRLPENVLLLAQYWPISSAAWILYPRESESTLIVMESKLDVPPDDAAGAVLTYRHGVLGTPDPYASVERLLSEAIRGAGLERARIGIELGYESVATGHTGGEVFVPAAASHGVVQRAAPEATLVDCVAVLDEARRRKSPREIDALKRCNAIAAFGLDYFHEACEPGRTEAEVASQVEAIIQARGIGYEGTAHVRAWAQLMSGARSAEAYSVHPATSARRIEAGDLCVLELATVADGFWSDLTRTVVAGGSPTDRQLEMYGAVENAVATTIMASRAGMKGETVDRIAREQVDERGFGDLFFHPTGHGLGFRYHETAPTLRPGSKDRVEDGAVTSIEPGLYIPDFGGMRLEQNVVFHEHGVEVLSLASTSLTG